MKEGANAGAPNLEDLMPEDLRRSWWNHTRNKFSVTQLCPTLCSPPGSSVLWILQARILEWAVISFSRRSFQPRDWTRVFRTAGRLFTNRATREQKYKQRHNKWTALETSPNLPPPICQKLVFQNNSRGQGRNVKCTRLSQVAGLGRCWSRGVPRGRTSLVWGPQQTSDSLGDEGRDLFYFFKISLWDKLGNSLTVFLIKCFLSLLICEEPTVTITVLIHLTVLLMLWI